MSYQEFILQLLTTIVPVALLWLNLRSKMEEARIQAAAATLAATVATRAAVEGTTTTQKQVTAVQEHLVAQDVAAMARELRHGPIAPTGHLWKRRASDLAETEGTWVRAEDSGSVDPAVEG